MARRLSREQSSQKYTRRPSSTEQVQVSGRVSAVLPQRAQVRGSSGAPASFTLATIARRGVRGPAQRTAGAGPDGPAPATAPRRARVLSA